MDRFGLLWTVTLLASVAGMELRADDPPASADTGASTPAVAAVSYHKDVRPLLQAHCQGCHQPARSGGGYALTTFERLLQPGESGDPAIVPGRPDESYLLTLITPREGQAEMPKGKAPLPEADIARIRLWIEQGAHDDTPENAQSRYDADHPPVYSRLPIVTSLAYSPDGQLLAVAGFHEVLVHHADGSGLVARLVGMSERIESVAFSPDGRRLAVAGGSPGLFGELQVWERSPESTPAASEEPAQADDASTLDSQPSTPQWKLALSLPVTTDTIYGASWSPDGKLIAVGCSDSTVRAFDTASGTQVFFNGAHDDWALDTIFSADGSHLVSVGRDMTTKLYNVATQRFIDNVTSITPGALKGGISAVARHPSKDEVLVGGADGTPRIYRMHRVTKRVIGDDANLIRQFPALTGRLFGVAYSPDGQRIAVAGTLDSASRLAIYTAEFDSTMPKDIEGIVQKVVSGQSAEEKQRLQEWVTADVKLQSETPIATAIFAVNWSPDGSTIAVSGVDGLVRLVDAADGTIRREFAPIEVAENTDGTTHTLVKADAVPITEDHDEPGATDLGPSQGVPALLVMRPEHLDLRGPGAYGQIHITGWYTAGDGETFDVTRQCELSIESGTEVASVNTLGRVIALSDGEAILKATLGDQTARIRVAVTGMTETNPVSFVRDVNPVLSRLGCNQGTCHGANDGKNGFKLSLRGYDPIFDVRAFTDDLKSRRTNIASPDDSLMLLKATGVVPHVGGRLTQPGHPYYETIRRWIAEGATLDLDVPRVASIAIQPEKPIIDPIGGRQQFQVFATYTNGEVRDVTREVFIESGNTEVAEINRAGIARSVRRGEAPIMARFEGQYAATTLTVMGDRNGFWDDWQQPEAWSPIDEFVATKWKRMKIQPSDLCTDAEFIRRVHLDLTGLPPSADEVRAFLADERPTRVKRDELVDRLVDSEAYVDYWSNKWADLLQVNGKFLGGQGAKNFRTWIREQIAANTPYDQFCHAVLTAAGSNKTNPPASYYKVLREPTEIMENTTHLFLGVRFNCNKCHDHPFERWNQDQYYETAAFFAQVGLDRDPENKDGNIGGTAVEGAKPLWEVISDKTTGEITHVRTGAVTAPKVPYDHDIAVPADGSRRQQLAAWITSPDNDYFARSYVNRVWGYLLGVGLIEPIDDIRAGNPPSNPELLEWLTGHFVESGFDVRNLMRTICKSRVYQLSVATNRWNEDDQLNYSHAVPKRLPAEVLYDTVYSVTGAKMKIPGVPEGTRAAALPDATNELPDNFLANLGRPARESSCECERSSDLQLGPVMALMNGSTVSEAISQDGNILSQLVASQPDDLKLIDELFLRILNRPASEQEIEAVLAVERQLSGQHTALLQERAAYQEQIAPVLAERATRREQAIAAAQSAYDARQEEIRPAEEAAEAERMAKIAAALKAVTEHEQALVARLPEWESKAGDSQTAWVALDPRELKTSTGAKLEKEADLSVFASGPNNKKGNYTLTATTDLTGITGIKLEVFADPRFPSNGPGRSPNGNFVLSEFTVEAAPKGKPKDKQKLKLQNAKADFSQQGYDVATAIDDKAPESGNGWATHPQTGVTRTALFELKDPLTRDGASDLFFKLDQQYSGRDHTIGRFRISVTTQPLPLDFGLPQDIQQIVRTPADQRSEEQVQALVEHLKNIDPELQKLRKALAEAEKPRPEDTRLVELRGKLQEARQPLPIDPQMARLDRAMELSQQQLENSRLTTAQDLAWALINSPAFLFNR